MNKNIFHKIVGDISMLWWAFWSNIRFRKSIRHNLGIDEADKANKLTDIKALVKKLYKNFKWTADGPDQLWDAITPPPQNYHHYVSGVLKDDCDGFHSLVYYCLFNSDVLCRLLTVNSIKKGHCVLIFKLDNKWYVNDYRSVYGEFETPEDAILYYNKIYEEDYEAKKVVYNGLIKYNFEKGKFYKENIRNLK